MVHKNHYHTSLLHTASIFHGIPVNDGVANQDIQYQ